MKLATIETCTACMACVDACSHSVIAPELDIFTGYYRIKVVREDACTKCGLCVRSCPVLTPVQQYEPISSFAVWAKDDALRRECASGGAFGAMALNVISQGGIAFGARIDGFDVVHSCAETQEELRPLLGSKYQHSSTIGTYRRVRKELLSGRQVLFSGLSCQVAGLKAFLGKKKYDNLITVDTICGGVATMLPMLWLKKSGKYTGIHSFRNKEYGWRPNRFRYDLKMIRRDGSIEDMGYENPVLNTFSSKLLKRDNCLNCQFNGAARVADITIGDFWGDSANSDQHSRGVSIAIVRNESARKLVENSLEYRPTTINKIAVANPNLLGGRHPLVRYLPTRGMALRCQREGKFEVARRLMSPRTLPGMLLRLAVKLS